MTTMDNWGFHCDKHLQWWTASIICHNSSLFVAATSLSSLCCCKRLLVLWTLTTLNDVKVGGLQSSNETLTLHLFGRFWGVFTQLIHHCSFSFCTHCNVCSQNLLISSLPSSSKTHPFPVAARRGNLVLKVRALSVLSDAIRSFHFVSSKDLTERSRSGHDTGKISFWWPLVL